MKLEDKIFEKLPYCVDGKVSYIKEYPELQKIPEFSLDTGFDFDKIFKWVVLIFSQETPLLEIKNQVERKIRAAQEVGFNDEKEDVKEFLSCRNDNVNAIIIAYLRRQKNKKFAMLMAYEDAFYNQLAKIQAGNITGEKTKDRMLVLDQLEIKIEKLTADLLSQDKSRELKHKLLDRMEEDRLDYLRPEGIAQSKQEEKDPLRGFNPYEVSKRVRKPRRGAANKQ